MRAITQDRVYWRPDARVDTAASNETSEAAIVIIWSLTGLAVAALCNLSTIYAEMGELLALLG